MTTTTLPQGDTRLLEHPTAVELLGSRELARLAYTAADGSPRVLPIYFHWTGTDQPGVRMARIAFVPTWVGVIDFQTRFPGAQPERSE